MDWETWLKAYFDDECNKLCSILYTVLELHEPFYWGA